MRSTLAVLLVLAAAVSNAHAQSGATEITIAQPAEATSIDPGRSTQVLTVKHRELSTEATQIFHGEKPALELFQEIAVYGASKRVSFKVRPDFRLIVAEMTVAQ